MIASLALAAEYQGTISVGSINSPASGISGTSYSLSNGNSCTSSSQCPSGNCAYDYDSTGQWCAPAGKCTHSSSSTCDSNCYNYANGSSLCEDSSALQTCSSGNWILRGCSCSGNACTSSDSGSSSSGSGNSNVERSSINETCMTDSECISGYCVHTKCRATAIYCGDGYCDAGENCEADSTACSSDKKCTNGCQLKLAGSALTATKVAMERSEIKNAIKKNERLYKAIESVSGINLTDEIMEKIANNSERLAARITYRYSVLEGRNNESLLVLNITLNGTEKAMQFIVYDAVPKSFSRNSSELSVETDATNITIIEKDPIFMFVFSSLYPGQKKTITYSVNHTTEGVLNDTSQPMFLAMEMKEIPCGDSICEYGENGTCPQDCANSEILMYIGIAAASAVVIAVVLKFVPKRKTGKPKAKGSASAVKPKRYAPKIGLISQKLKKIKENRKKKFVYKYES